MFHSRAQALAALGAPAVSLALTLTAAAPAAASAPAPSGDDQIPGFTKENSDWQRRYERLFKAVNADVVALRYRPTPPSGFPH